MIQNKNYGAEHRACQVDATAHICRVCFILLVTFDCNQVSSRALGVRDTEDGGRALAVKSR